MNLPVNLNRRMIGTGDRPRRGGKLRRNHPEEEIHRVREFRRETAVTVKKRMNQARDAHAAEIVKKGKMKGKISMGHEGKGKRKGKNLVKGERRAIEEIDALVVKKRKKSRRQKPVETKRR